jgi:hypothetical protein
MVFAAAGYLLLGILLWQLHHLSTEDYRPPGAGPDVQHQLTWIGGSLRHGSGEAMQTWYPEGYFFAHALYGCALVNQAILERERDPALVQRNAREVEWVIERLESEAGRAPFPKEQAVEHGVFYLGWLNRLVGGLLLLQPEPERDPRRVALFHRQSEALAQAFTASPSHHLEAYPGQSWPVDNVVALTSLQLHDTLYGTGYQSVIHQFLAFARGHPDPATGLLPHSIDARTGLLREGSRGSSLVLALSFLPELDPDFARSQYRRFRKLYAIPMLDFILVREYPQGVDGPEDVDSGPLIFGVSPFASGVGLAAARANGDEEMFGRMVQLSEVVGAPIDTGGEKRFCLGRLAIGDAFLAWGKTVTPWSVATPFAGSAYPRLTSRWYGWTNSLILLAAVLLGCLALRARRPN